MELEQFREALEAEGIRVAAVTYDSQENLRRFAERFSIGYPLLSDTESRVIRDFGILNRDMPKGHQFHGIPYPGNFLLGADGVVKAKYFLPDYQTRPSASEVLARTFDRSDGPAAEIQLDEATVRIALSDSRVVPGRQLGVTVDLSIAPGWHLYGEPLPDNYVPTRIVFEADLAADQTLELPEPNRVRFELLGETLPVYSGSVRGIGTLLIRSRLAPGRYVVKGKLQLQACQDESCGTPQMVPFEIPIEVAAQTPTIESTSG